MSAPVLIMAGGTGGHIFPGIAVGQELVARGVPVVWLGTDGGLETRLVPPLFPIHTLKFSGVRGKRLVALALAPLRLLRAVWTARAILRRVQPRSVLSMGGYAAAPGGIAAWLARIPVVVHEQNRIAGMTNRLLARFARRVLTGFSDTLAGGEWVGNPVRAGIAALPPPSARQLAERGALRVLVLGGSQGARFLNTGVPKALATLGDAMALTVRHQCGARHADQAAAAQALYAGAGITATLEPFIDDMVAAYAWADVVVCRAGALTLAELAAAGLPSLLVPFPHAVDDHQTRNAQVLVDAGAARLLPEAQGGDEILVAQLRELLADRAALLAMATAARTLSRPDAAARIADVCLEVGA